MVLHGLRDETSDIDIGCSTEYFEELLSEKYPMKTWDDGMRSLDYPNSIDDLIAHKESLNRPKDQKDLEVLYQESE